EYDLIGLELELAAGHRDRTPPPGVVGLAKFHADATHGADIALALVKNFDRGGEPMEFDPLFLGVMNLFGSCWALRPGPSIDAVHFTGAEPQGDPHRVHGGIAGADHGDALAERKRGIIIREFLRRIKLQRVSNSFADSTPLSESPGMPSIDG